MDLSHISAGTPKVLSHCLRLFDSTDKTQETAVTRTAPATPAKFLSHPDIQFFSSIKAKNHYAYHKLKRANADENGSSIRKLPHGPRFDPFSRDLLLQRLSTYTSLAWCVPSAQSELSELFCASYGWECLPLSRGVEKNTLCCCVCRSTLILRFNSIDQQPPFAPFEFDAEDVKQLNHGLSNLYLRQIRRDSHLRSCPWRDFPSPLRTAYYVVPYLEASDAFLMSDYVAVLKHNTDELMSLKVFEALIAPLVVPSKPDSAAFCAASDQWLVNRFFKEKKENLLSATHSLHPHWVYHLSAQGWTFLSGPMATLECKKCFKRVFLPSDESLLTEFNHKQWCLFKAQIDQQPLDQYLAALVVNVRDNMDPNGDFREKEACTFTEVSSSETPKRKSTDSIDEDLQKFSKLRKLYFAD